MLFRLTLTILMATSFITGVHAGEMDEHQVKAAFLYNFAKFVDWPPTAFRTPEEPFGVCILGEDPFGRALDDVVAGGTISGRPLVVRRISNRRKMEGCHLVFVSSAAAKRQISAREGAMGPGILTVGEAGNSSRDGLVITFVLEGGKVRFRIDLVAAEDQKLRLSSKLLSRASVVRRK